jgi:anti-sigma28 factor (negative regulator of flagellin synthesis)
VQREYNPTSPARQSRRQRILQLRESIESGDYRVSAAELADALTRAARRTN